LAVSFEDSISFLFIERWHPIRGLIDKKFSSRRAS
jgi:hypothetical protein